MNRKEGFTLLELLVVVIIIGAFFFVAVPKFKDITETNIKSASRDLSATIKYSYNEAAFKKSILRLVFDLEEGVYWLEKLQGEEYEAITDSKIKRLPKGVYFKDIVTERSQNRNPLEDENEYILFLPTGFVEPAVIHIYTESDKNYTLATKPYTGGTKVYNEYMELLAR